MDKLKMFKALQKTLAFIAFAGLLLLLFAINAMEMDKIPFLSGVIWAAVGVIAFGGGIVGVQLTANEIEYIKKKGD